MPTVQLDDVSLFYTEEGVGKPIVLVHGWTCDQQDWTLQIPVLAERHRVIAVDQRGHGRSSTPASDYRMTTYARDLATLLARLDLYDVVLMGHSLGGMVVSLAAIEAPDRVRGVVAVDAVGGATAEMLRGTAKLFEDAGDEGALATAAAVFDSYFYTATTPRHHPGFHRRRLLGMPPHVVRETIVALGEEADLVGLPGSARTLARRPCPVLAVSVEERPWEARLLAQRPGSRAVVFEGSGHWPHQEQPETFNSLVLDWIAEL